MSYPRPQTVGTAARPAAITAEAATSRSRLLAMRAYDAACRGADDETRRVESDAARLADRLTRMLETCPVADIPALSECSEHMYRLGYRRKPDPVMTDALLRRVLEAWRQGERGLSESGVFAMLARKVEGSRGETDRQFRDAYRKILEGWMETLGADGGFPQQTSYEAYSRLALLTPGRIERYLERPAEARRRWYERHRVDDLGDLSVTLLRVYRSYIASLMPDVLSGAEREVLDSAILKEMLRRPGLDPADREACRLALR